MTANQAVAQPFAQEQIELGLFIRLMHRLVRVGIQATKAPGIIRHHHFSHARIVIDAHLETRP